MRPSKTQRRELDRWLWHLTGIYNWAIRLLELGWKDRMPLSLFDLTGRAARSGVRLGVPGDVVQGAIKMAHRSWESFRGGHVKRPKLRGQRHRLNSIEISARVLRVEGGRLNFVGMREGMRYHHQPGLGLIDALADMPKERLRGGRLIKRGSGWYLSVIADVEPIPVKPVAEGEVGIDLGFARLATLSTGEVIEHPRELAAASERIGQAQRGGHRKLTARLRERQANRIKDRNHKLSRRLVAENRLIVVSKDNLAGMARTRFGKSVAGAGHAQLRAMLAYKCRAGGREYVEASNFKSTQTCSACGAITGPRGKSGLAVRAWECAACGAAHDRDVNAAVNTLRLGAGQAHEIRNVA